MDEFLVFGGFFGQNMAKEEQLWYINVIYTFIQIAKYLGLKACLVVIIKIEFLTVKEKSESYI